MPVTLDAVMRGHLDHAADGLIADFQGFYSRETIVRFLEDSVDELAAQARVATYIPLLAERFARERLAALAQSEGKLGKTVPEVVFVCVRNAGRSQLAAALMKERAKGRVHVCTAGSDPADEINPAVGETLAEFGIDLGEEFPKPLTDEVVRAADVLVTMGCGDACPVYPGKRYLDWEVDDPAGKSLEEVRRIRDDIDARVQDLLKSLTGGRDPAPN